MCLAAELPGERIDNRACGGSASEGICSMNHKAALGILVAGLSLGSLPLSAQSVPKVSGGPGWAVRSAAHVDLWYHGLAVVGFEGFSPLPLYAPEYAARIRRAKEAQGVYPTTLDRLRSYFRVAFASDSTYEIFHFLPLYFGSPDPDSMLAALAAAARGGGETPDEFGARVLADVLTRKNQREVAGQFIQALEEEWEVFLRADREANAARREDYLAAVEQQWSEELGPAIQGFLSDRRLERGVILTSPALGPEGRVFLGDPADEGDNLVAVGMPAGLDDPSRVLFAAVRELCYPVASREVARHGVPGKDRVTAERWSSRAAIRCGAMLLEVRAPELAAPYRDAYVRAARLDPERVTFENAFPVDAQLLKAVRRELRLPESSE